MNIQMQLCGLLITLLILYFYKRHETVGLYTEKLFRFALYITIESLVLDILSVVLIMNTDRLPLILVKGECKLYLASLVITTYAAFAYASADVTRMAKTTRYVRAFGIASGVVCLLIMFLPVSIYQEGSVVYTYGPAVTATYLSTVLLIVLIMAGVLRRDGGMNPKRRRALITWLALWLIAAAVQFMNNRLLVVGFASALGDIVMFISLDNNQSNIDRSTGNLYANAFWEFMRQNYMSSANNCGMLVSLEDSASKDVRGDRLDAAVIEIADFFRRVPETKIFRMDEYEFALLFANQENLDRARHILAKRFSEPWLEYNESYAPINIKPYYLIVPAGNVAGSVNEVIGMMKYFRAHYMNNSESRVLVLNEDVICRKKAREDMLHTITEALENDRVEVFFQPIYSTQLKKFVSAEALVRIRKEDGGIIPPGMFIPIAEETGMISWIGKRVFEKTCEFIKQTDIGRYGIEYIEVNLSVVQCEDEALADLYIDVMERYKISPSLINLEITESASIIMRKTLLNNMRKLIDYGVSFSLDDFGNGESNLNYIVDMPVHIVKFDKDMTQAYFVSEKAKYVLQAATDMIQGLHLLVVSEGVETADQLRAMERLGIDYIQGYYFSRPLEASQFIEFLKVANG